MQKQATQLLALLVAILIIWFVVPLISIDHRVLLPKTPDRLFAISIVLITWIAYLVFQLIKTVHAAEDAASKHSNGKDSKLLELTKIILDTFKRTKSKAAPSIIYEGSYAEANLIQAKHFQLVCDYFRTNSKKKKHPVYLILGNKYSGKSALLNSSGLTLKTIPNIPTRTHDEESSEDIANCLWNLHENAVFIDTPGDYASSEVTENLQTPWRNLIYLLLRKYQHFPLKGVILTLSIHDLLTNSPQATRIHLHLLKQRILEIKKYYGEMIPLHLIFTKWDCVPGFSEFFDHLTLSERQKSFAIEFNKDFSEQSITSQLHQQYELILQQMSRLLITRMHQEHNQKKRALISQFPLQMEQLEKVFSNVVKQLMEKSFETDIALPTSIYFTSTSQTNETIDLLYQKFQSNFSLPEKQLTVSPHVSSKDFFIQAVFQKFANCQKPARSELVISRKNQYLIYGVTAVVVIGFAGVILTKFITGLKTINQAETSAYALSLANDSFNDPTAEKKAALVLARQVDHASHFWLSKKITPENFKSAKETISVPIVTLPIVSKTKATSILLSAKLQQFLESTLTSNSTAPEILYSTLKAYLMLSQPNHLQLAWLKHWLTNNAVNNQIITTADMQTILADLQKKQVLFMPQTESVEQARKNLTSLPTQYLAFIMLQSHANYAVNNDLSIIIANKTLVIPFLFTAKGLQTLFLNNIHKSIQNAVNGNWVLGQSATSKPVSPVIQQELISMYISNYVSWWTKVFFEINVPTFTNFQDLANYTTFLNDPNQGIIHAYNLILQNTNANVIFPPSVNTPLISDLRNSLVAQVNSNLNDLNHLNLNSVQSALTQYSQFLNNLINTNNIPQTAFLMLKNQIQHPNQPNILLGFEDFARALPEPLSSSFATLAKQSIQLTRKAAANYLQTAWETQVMQFYNENLADRYPLYAASQQDASLSAFSQFFGPNGLLEQFYQSNLAMFINTSSSVWQWQNLNGLNIPFNNQLLLALEKARIITAMFFPQNGAKMQVAFTLQQIALMPIVQSFSLTMDGQKLYDAQGSQNVSSFVWPGNSNNLGTKISFLDVNGQHVTTEAQGPWSWFRLLGASSMQQKKSPQNYRVIFDVDGNEAKYTLSAENSINPFIPGIINTFSLPGQIVS